MGAQQELHVPVMLTEIVALLAPALDAPLTEPSGDTDCVLVDCTLGLGGHALCATDCLPASPADRAGP
jgi:16S rRNA (cytosine1402-N4)-methyltransferase